MTARRPGFRFEVALSRLEHLLVNATVAGFFAILAFGLYLACGGPMP